jgi:hypothetical protein
MRVLKERKLLKLLLEKHSNSLMRLRVPEGLLELRKNLKRKKPNKKRKDSERRKKRQKDWLRKEINLQS